MSEQIPPQQPPQNPGYFLPPAWQSMPPQDEDEINLLDLLLVVAKHKRMILKFSFLAAIVVAGISLLVPNTYRAEVLVAPAQSEELPSGGLASLSGLASLAGVSIGGGSDIEQSLAIVQSREFLWLFVQENNLMPILFESEWDAKQNKWEEDDPAEQPGPFDVQRLMLEDHVLSVSKDDETSLVTVGIEWKDATLAAEWANALVARANKYLADEAIARSKGNLQYLNEQLTQTRIEEFRNTLFELIANEQRTAMLASAQKDYAFRVLDPARVPDEKIKPKRALVVVLAAFVAVFMAIVWAFVKEGMARASEQPEQQQRLRELFAALSWKK